jgi:hypothetical protein
MIMSILNQLPKDRLLVDFSLWSCDLTNMAGEIRRTEPFAEMYHLDVADGHFVPSLLFFPDLVAAPRPLTRRAFHVHLMATNPAGQTHQKPKEREGRINSSPTKEGRGDHERTSREQSRSVFWGYAQPAGGGAA